MDCLVAADISKDYFDSQYSTGLAAEDHAIEALPNDRQGFKALASKIKKARGTKIYLCIEATGSYWKNMAKYFHDLGWTVFVVNPARIKGQRKTEQRRSKTDKIDAGVILRFLRAQISQLKPWTPPGESIESLQSLFRFRDLLVADRTRYKNHLKSESEIDEVAEIARNRVQQLDGDIDVIERKIEDVIQGNRELAEMDASARSVSGVGPIAACALISETRGLNGFTNPKQITAFAGLDVVEESSGTSIRKKPHISHQGSALIRKAFYMAAIQAIKCNPAVGNHYQKLRRKGMSHRPALTAAARKLLEITFAVVLSKSKWLPDYCRETAKSAKTA